MNCNSLCSDNITWNPLFIESNSKGILRLLAIHCMISWFQLFCWSRPDCDAARICGRRSGNVIRHLDIFNVNAPEADEIILRKICRTCIGYCPEFELYKSTNELFTSRTKTKTGRKIKNIMRHRGNFLNLSYISSTRILISRGLN